MALYQGASFKGALLLVLVTGICCSFGGAFLLRQDVLGPIENPVLGTIKYTLQAVLLGIFGAASARFAGGRGDTVATMTIVGYVTALRGTLMFIGFLVLSAIGQFSGSEDLYLIVYAVIVLIVVLYSFVLSAMAIGLANDVSEYAAVFATFIGLIGAWGVNSVFNMFTASLGMTSELFFIPLLF